MKKQEHQADAGPSERPRKQRSRTFNRHAIPSAATSKQNSNMQQPPRHESVPSARNTTYSNTRRISHLGSNQQQQSQQQKSQQQQKQTQQQKQQQQQPQQQRQKQESSGLPRSSRIEEAIALSDSRPSSSTFIKRNTSSLSPGNSEIKPLPFVVEISNIPPNTSQIDIEDLIQETASEESFKIIKIFTAVPARAVLRIENLAVCNSIVQALNSYQWRNYTLAAELKLDATEKSSQFSGSANESFKPEFNRSYIPPQYRQPSLSRKNNSFYRPQRSTNSTMSSFDSRRSTTASSRASSRGSSIFSNYNHRHSSNLSTISSGSVQEKPQISSYSEGVSLQGVEEAEPVIEDGKEDEEHDGTNKQQEEPVNAVAESSSIDDHISDDFIEIPEGEGDNPDRLIKVSPTRLFVGNVPYTSTWASLRRFLIERANEIDPDNNISILRVEIPVSHMSLNEGFFYGQGGIGQPQIVSRSRGFAIVTTKSRASSEKLIKLLNNVEFEGRALTIRYDKFPQFDNYIVQQLHRPPAYSRNVNTFGGPFYNSSSYGQAQGYNQQMPPVPFVPQQALYNAQQKFNSTHPTSSSLLSNLAFERNSLQQKIYYRNTPNSQTPYSTSAPTLQGQPPPPGPTPLMQPSNMTALSNPNQNPLASGYYYMPYYYQGSPQSRSNMYQQYGVPLGSPSNPAGPASVPSQYHDQYMATPQASERTPVAGSSIDEQQETSDLFQNLSLDEK
ncbi:hypothetical protein I9W82_001282 [Candida metapsilosis]|uniref:RRM domain-containing protein n=1 Tax=Candida metapsilosis TaxID=273372 RepID=A0A8H7ZHK3_9ASCO|nr:hypothetical protein I9W82_001282 [Candida metapsilosis]